MFKGHKREHSEGSDEQDDGGDVQEGLTLEQRRAAFSKILWSVQLDPNSWYPLPGKSIQMALHDSETGKVVKKVRKLLRPTVKSTTPLPGWRAWRLIQSNEGEVLRSVTMDYIWLGPVATTKKNSNGQPARLAVDNPVKITNISDHLDPGIYSYKTPKLLETHHGLSDTYILGRLDNYGHIVEHDFGYRAQKVIIRELWATKMPFWRDVVIEDLSSRYDCPVHFLPENQLAHWIDFYSEESTDV